MINKGITMKTESARTAKAIKAELKKSFPAVKFSVRSSNFAGGNSVDIEWVDGPTTEKVDGLTSKYQYGHFNGMEDYYEMSNTRDDIPQAKYIMTRRNISPETKAKIEKHIADFWGVTTDAECMEKNSCYLADLIYRESSKTDYMPEPVKKTSNKYASEREELEALRKWKARQAA